MQSTKAGRAATLAAALLLFAACTPSSAPGVTSPTPRQLAGWAPVALPNRMQPASLALSGDRLLVGGHLPGQPRRPALAAVTATSSSSARPVALHPVSPYAAVADLVSVAADDRQVVALGAAHGGAHANFRWTTWTGTVHGLAEHPQTFETFGGQQAGSLLGVAMTSEGPVIAGSWSGRYGLDAAVWSPDGDRWVRLPSRGTPLANTATEQVAPRSVAADGATEVLTGSTITLGNGARQSAAVWTSASRMAGWQLVRLPDPGTRSEARSTRCTGATCWISGYVDGTLALWSLTGGQAVRESGLPQVGVDVDGPGPRTLLAGTDVGVIFNHAGQTALALRTAAGWQLYAGPSGTVVDAITVGTRVYAAVATSDSDVTLWSVELPS